MSRGAIGRSEHEILYAEEGVRQVSQDTLVVASDASSKGYGWVLYWWREGTLTKVDHEEAEAIRSWDSEQIKEHIFLKEMRASVEATNAARRLFPKARLMVVIDNSACYYGIMNGFTSSVRGQAIMDQGAPLSEGDEVILVVSKDNPSDCHSRGEFKDYGERVTRLQETLRMYQRGGREERDHKIFHRLRDGLRHAEGESDEENSEMDECVELPEEKDVTEEVMLRMFGEVSETTVATVELED